MQYFSRRLGLVKAALLAGAAVLTLSGCEPGPCVTNKYEKQYPDRQVFFAEGCEKSPDVIEIVYNDDTERQLIRIEDFNRNGVIGDDQRDEYKRGRVGKNYPNTDASFQLEGLYRAGFVSTPEGVLKSTGGSLGRIADDLSNVMLWEATRKFGDELKQLELAIGH